MRDGEIHFLIPSRILAGEIPPVYPFTSFPQDKGVGQMAHKGRLPIGPDADITIFDTYYRALSCASRTVSIILAVTR